MPKKSNNNNNDSTRSTVGNSHASGEGKIVVKTADVRLNVKRHFKVLCVPDHHGLRGNEPANEKA